MAYFMVSTSIFCYLYFKKVSFIYLQISPCTDKPNLTWGCNSEPKILIDSTDIHDNFLDNHQLTSFFFNEWNGKWAVTKLQNWQWASLRLTILGNKMASKALFESMSTCLERSKEQKQTGMALEPTMIGSSTNFLLVKQWFMAAILLTVNFYPMSHLVKEMVGM